MGKSQAEPGPAERTPQSRGFGGAAALAAAYLATSGLLLWATAGAVRTIRSPGAAGPDEVVAVIAAAGAWAVLSWLTAVTVLALLTAAVAGLGSSAHRRAIALAPAASRRLVGTLLGITIVASPLTAGLPAEATVPAAAAAPGAGQPHALTAAARPVAAPAADALDRPAAAAPTGWTPDRPVAPHRRTARSTAAVRLVAPAPRPERAVADEVVVRRGDTLWDIACRHLGPGASAAEIAAEWPRWHRVNRAVIGDEPDRLVPGERLVPPDA